MSKEPDLFAIVRWIDSIKDPVEGFTTATKYADMTRDQLLPELAGRRRLLAVAARAKLMRAGHTATEATRLLAEQANASPQTINRMISERKQYGYQEEGQEEVM